MNSFPNVNFWRFVYQQDPIPRLPISEDLSPLHQEYYHAGHLIDITKTDGGYDSKAYYFQNGGDGYAGVPDSWNYDFIVIPEIPDLGKLHLGSLQKENSYALDFLRFALFSHLVF